MRFAATICNAANILARVSIDDSANESLGQNALRARTVLIRDANRLRSNVLKDVVLERMAEIYGEVVASQIISREKRYVTCFSKGDHVHQRDGQIALLSNASDIIMLIEVWTDDYVRQMDAFVDDAMSTAA